MIKPETIGGPSIITAEEAINNILAYAKTARKGDYQMYKFYKDLISDVAVDRNQYEQAIRKLADILHI